MCLPDVVDVEPLVVRRNRDHVEEGLEVRVTILRVEQVGEGHITEGRKSVEPVVEDTNVLVARP